MSGGAAQSYRYLRPSALVADRDGADLGLSTSGGRTPSGPAANPRFFTGFLTTPAGRGGAAGRRRGGAGPLPPSRQPGAASTRWSPATATGCGSSRSPAAAACTPGSTCCRPASTATSSSTAPPTSTSTPPLREALARVGGVDPLHLSVGPDDADRHHHGRRRWWRRRCRCPTRWLRGFAEVQVIAAGVRPARRAPRRRGRARSCAGCLRRSDRSALLGGPGRAVAAADGPARCRARSACRARSGSPRCAGCCGFAKAPAGVRAGRRAGSRAVPSAWELDSGALRLSLTLSPEPYRGFSGEGAVLDALAGDDVGRRRRAGRRPARLGARRSTSPSWPTRPA